MSAMGGAGAGGGGQPTGWQAPMLQQQQLGADPNALGWGGAPLRIQDSTPTQTSWFQNPQNQRFMRDLGMGMMGGNGLGSSVAGGISNAVAGRQQGAASDALSMLMGQMQSNATPAAHADAPPGLLEQMAELQGHPRFDSWNQGGVGIGGLQGRGDSSMWAPQGGGGAATGPEGASYTGPAMQQTGFNDPVPVGGGVGGSGAGAGNTTGVGGGNYGNNFAGYMHGPGSSTYYGGGGGGGGGFPGGGSMPTRAPAPTIFQGGGGQQGGGGFGEFFRDRWNHSPAHTVLDTLRSLFKT